MGSDNTFGETSYYLFKKNGFITELYKDADIKYMDNGNFFWIHEDLSDVFLNDYGEMECIGSGIGKSIQDCKNQIDEFLNDMEE